MKIPDNIEQATEALAGIESLLTKKGWERAAILAAFVRLSTEGGDRRSITATSSSEMSPTAFAALGIAGLRSKDTVRSYVENWLSTHDGIYPEPGADVILPDGDYPPGGARGNTQDELIQSAVRKGTLVEKLTPEQKVEVAASIIREVTEASTPLSEERKALAEAAGISHITTKDEMKQSILADKEHEARVKPMKSWVPPIARAQQFLMVEFGNNPELWRELYDWIGERMAEYAVDGVIKGARRES